MKKFEQSQIMLRLRFAGGMFICIRTKERINPNDYDLSCPQLCFTAS